MAATDPILGYDDRAVAALLAALCAAERGVTPDMLRWLRQCNGLICCFVNEQLHYMAAILSERAPDHVRQDLERQRSNGSRISAFLFGHRLRTAHLRELLRAEAHAVLPVWSDVRDSIRVADPSLRLPAPRIGSDDGHYQPHAKLDEGDIPHADIEFATTVGARTVAGAATIVVNSARVGQDGLWLEGCLQVQPDIPFFKGEWWNPMPVVAAADEVWFQYGSGYVTTTGEKGVLLSSDFSEIGLDRGVHFTVHRPFSNADFRLNGHIDVVRLSTPECAFTLRMGVGGWPMHAP